MRVLVACEYSGVVRDAFIKKGHDAYSCDLLPSERGGGYHMQCDVREIIYDRWDIIIAHPECTYMANSGVRWLYSSTRQRNEERWKKLSVAMCFFNLFYYHPFCNKICIENPIPHRHARLPKFTQSIQPYEFGHTTSKRTCLWLKGLPKLNPTIIIPKEQRTQDIWLASPGPDRWKQRSRTFQGIADAMADQWG